MINKSDFVSSVAYGDQIAKDALRGREPVDPKLSELCISDVVRVVPNTSLAVGECSLAQDGCTYSVDKDSNVSGHCLKRVLGVQAEL